MYLFYEYWLNKLVKDIKLKFPLRRECKIILHKVGFYQQYIINFYNTYDYIYLLQYLSKI